MLQHLLLLPGMETTARPISRVGHGRNRQKIGKELRDAECIYTEHWFSRFRNWRKLPDWLIQAGENHNNNLLTIATVVDIDAVIRILQKLGETHSNYGMLSVSLLHYLQRKQKATCSENKIAFCSKKKAPKDDSAPYDAFRIVQQ